MKTRDELICAVENLLHMRIAYVVDCGEWTGFAMELTALIGSACVGVCEEQITRSGAQGPNGKMDVNGHRSAVSIRNIIRALTSAKPSTEGK